MIRNFNITEYVNANPEVKQAVDDGTLSEIEAYLETTGLEKIKLGEQKFHPDFEPFDETAYLKAFQGVLNVVNDGVLKSGFDHFCRYGYQEIIEDRRKWPHIESRIEVSLPSESSKILEAESMSRDEQLAIISEHFDEEIYKKNNSDLLLEGFNNLLHHYFDIGSQEGRWPNKWFDPQFYKETYPDVEGSGIEPLVHFIRIGYQQKRMGSQPKEDHQTDGKKEVSEKPQNSTEEKSLAVEEQMEIIKNHFDAEYYKFCNNDLDKLETEQLILHYLNQGSKEGRKPNKWFDPKFYLTKYHDVEHSYLEPFVHFIQIGYHENRMASEPSNQIVKDYSEKRVSQRDSSFEGAREDGKAQTNVEQKRKDAYLINYKNYYLMTVKYLKNKKAAFTNNYQEYKKSKSKNALERFLKASENLIQTEERLSVVTDRFLYEFDEDAYLECNNDVKKVVDSKKIDSGLEHLIFYGWQEVNNGERRLYKTTYKFDEEKYLNGRADVIRAIKEKKIHSALQHFIVYGQNEQKNISPIKGQNELAGDRKHEPKLRTIIICAHIVGKTLFGSERSLLDMLEGAAQTSNVILLAPMINDDYYAHVKKWITKLYVVPYGWWREGTNINDSNIERIEKIIIDNNVNIVHVNTIMLREALIAGRNTGAATVTHIRELITGDEKLIDLIGEPMEAIVKEVKDRCDYFVGNSNATLEAYDLENDDRGYLLYNTVACDQFEMKALKDEIAVGIVSSNLPKKGIFDFAEVAKLCIEQKNLKFKVFGPENEHTKKLEEMQIPNFDICGYRSTPQEAMNEIDIVLNLSNFTESFGRTVAEGMASGKPVIAYRWGAPPELIDEGVTGYLVDYKDMASVAQRLKLLAANTERITAMGEQGKATAFSRFDISVYRDELGGIYDSIVKKEQEAKINIAYFLWHFPVPSETFVLNELRKLVQQNYNVKVYCKQSPYKDFTPDFPVEWKRIESVEHFAETLTADNRQIVHSHFVYPTVTDMVWPACEKANIPFTFIAHAQDIFRYKNEEKNRIDEISKSDKCYKVFVPSRFHFDYLKERGVVPEKMVITPNTVDPDLYSGGLKVDHVKREHRAICAIHRFTEKKGLSNLIRAAALMDDDITINIYGYGDLKEEYEQIIAENALSNVHIKDGVKGRAAMLDVYAKHDLFACPSVRAADGDMDGIPTVLMEAMASGIPVITTGISGIPDLVKNELTGMVTESTPEAIAESINRFYALSDTKVQAIVENARNAIETKFNTRYATENLLRVWEQKTIDLIIVSWNNLPELQEVCRRLLKFTTLPFHLIIVDNLSEKDVRDYLKVLDDSHDEVTVIFNESNDMVGPGTNIALEYGTSDYAIYVCGKEGFTFEYGWEIPLVKYMEHHPCVGQAGTLGYSPTYMYGKDYPAGIPLFDKFRNQSFATDNPERVFKHAQGGFFIMRRKMYDEIGGFSYDVPHSYTDVEYSYYVESCGWELGEIPEMLALFNKTRPGLFSRMDETMLAMHPPLMPDLPHIDRIVSKQVNLCNVCEWKEGDFITDVCGYKVCPNCGSKEVDRSVFRYVAESEYTHRRVPALAIDISTVVEDFWKKQFQGRIVSSDALMNEIQVKNKVDNADGKTYLIYMKYVSGIDNNVWKILLSEFGRLLHPEGEVIIHLTDECGSAVAETMLVDLAQHIKLVDTIRYKSEVCHYDWNKMLILRKGV